MKKLGIIVVLLLATFFNANRGEAAYRIKVCHNGFIIKVDLHAVSAHLSHGDELFTCHDREEDLIGG